MNSARMFAFYLKYFCHFLNANQKDFSTDTIKIKLSWKQLRNTNILRKRASVQLNEDLHFNGNGRISPPRQKSFFYRQNFLHRAVHTSQLLKSWLSNFILQSDVEKTCREFKNHAGNLSELYFGTAA